MSGEENLIQDFTVSLWPSSCSKIISDLNISVSLFLFLVHLAQHPHKVVEVFFLIIFCGVRWGSPGASAVKNPPASAGNTGSIPGLGKSPGRGNGIPLQYSCLENSMVWGTWQAIQSKGPQRGGRYWACMHHAHGARYACTCVDEE